MGLNSFFKNMQVVDFLAPPVRLTVGGNSGIKTYLGTFLSLCCGITMLSGCIVIITNYYSTSNPHVNQQISQSQVYPSMDLYANRYAPIFYFLKDSINAVDLADISKYITIGATKVSINYVVDEHNNFIGKHSFINFPVVPGSTLSESEKVIYDYVIQDTNYWGLAMQYGLCIQISEENSELFSVKGKMTDPESARIVYQIFPCMLQTGGADINELRRFGMLLSLSKHSLDISNKENPISIEYNGDEFYAIEI